MALVTSTFSKRIKVIGEERDLEMLFESLKFIRARDLEIHDFLISKVIQIVILEEEADPRASYAPPFGIFVEKEGLCLIIHPRDIRTGKYWCAALVIFQTALIHGVWQGDRKALRSTEALAQEMEDPHLIREALLTGVDFLKRIEAPAPEIRSFENLAAAFEPAAVVPVLPVRGACPMVDLIEPFEGLGAASASTWKLALRSDGEHRKLAERLGLSPELAGSLLLVPVRDGADGASQFAKVGVLAAIEQYQAPSAEHLSDGRATFQQKLQRYEILEHRIVDGIVIARIRQMPELTTKDNSARLSLEKLRAALTELQLVIVDDERAPHQLQRDARKPLPTSDEGLLSRAVRLLQFSPQAQATVLFAKQADWLARTAVAAVQRGLTEARLGTFPAQFRTEGREIYSAAFQDWFNKIAAISRHKQRRLVNCIEKRSWNVDLDSGTLRFDDEIEFRVQFLGSHNRNADDWLWGWANERSGLSAQIISAARQLKELGLECQLPELSTAHLNFAEYSLAPDSQELVHALALLATGLTGADGYYPVEGSGNIGIVLVYDDQKVLPQASLLGSLANEITLYLPESFMQLRIPPKRAFVDEYLEYFSQSLHRNIERQLSTAFLTDGSCLEVSYTSGGLLAGMKSVRMTEN